MPIPCVRRRQGSHAEGEGEHATVDPNVALDLDRVVEALDELEPVERFAAIVRDLLADGSSSG